MKETPVVVVGSGWVQAGTENSERARQSARLRSTATTTTATTRNAAQIHCAALGERELKAG
ncbi:hypothetical protein MUB01_18505 [Mycolicibacterium smegmatis]|jgi:hypothetical protein|nr:hypothetical protein [Mycolicibacterium smegmatis]ABK70864.1 hypothetical protein MSMEG_5787 [Mycolicibacterium smegmatis MC2 155]AIU10796.1 hypothetical protein LJ00_28615 [Mycolicibacterium smegmatis MC2 155]AIU17421.1 hypothetical protein LI99_28620 [Mycolicibacterium smegmatis]AIU24044.1 hypothetical protein LI98_28625 [Mycolicibacterium smegmatis]MBE9617687.1 hypothetical protein [Mycolicibacterium smegmatis]